MRAGLAATYQLLGDRGHSNSLAARPLPLLVIEKDEGRRHGMPVGNGQSAHRTNRNCVLKYEPVASENYRQRNVGEMPSYSRPCQ